MPADLIGLGRQRADVGRDQQLQCGPIGLAHPDSIAR
jgi:hypothetical protein